MLRYSVLKNVQTEMAEHHCAVVEGVRLKNNQNSRALWGHRRSKTSGSSTLYRTRCVSVYILAAESTLQPLSLFP
jgi:hypothetical protein